jgi:hypothetical protein
VGIGTRIASRVKPCTTGVIFPALRPLVTLERLQEFPPYVEASHVDRLPSPPRDQMIPYTKENGLRGYRPPVSGDIGDGDRRSTRPWRTSKRRLTVWVLCWWVLAFVLGILFGLQLQAAGPCVRLEVRPQFLLRTEDVTVEAHLARHADHRALTISWNSDAGAGGSRSFELDGTDTDRVRFHWINREQPAGRYLFDARVTDAGGRVLGSSRAEIRSLEGAP